MKVKDESTVAEADHEAEVDGNVVPYNAADAEQPQEDENNFGDGDMDMDDAGGEED